MSLIKKAVRELIMSQEWEDVDSRKKIAVTSRHTEDNVWRIDFIAQKLGLTRSSLVQMIVEDGVLEAAEELGISLSDMQAHYISEKSGKSLEDCKAMLEQTGFFPGKEVE